MGIKLPVGDKSLEIQKTITVILSPVLMKILRLPLVGAVLPRTEWVRAM